MPTSPTSTEAGRVRSVADDVLRPILRTLQSSEHDLDPAIAPAELVERLATWVGAMVDENWPEVTVA